MTIHKRARLTPVQRREIFDKYFNKGIRMRSAAAVQHFQTDNIPSAGKRQTKRFQYSQEYQQEVPVPGIRIQEAC